MLCSKLHFQKALDSIPFSYIVGAGVGGPGQTERVVKRISSANTCRSYNWFQSKLLDVYFNITQKDLSMEQISLNYVYDNCFDIKSGVGGPGETERVVEHRVAAPERLAEACPGGLAGTSFIRNCHSLEPHRRPLPEDNV